MSNMAAPERQCKPFVETPTIPYHVQMVRAIEDFVDDINWIHIAFKTCAFTYIAVIAWITWHVLPLPGHWDTGRQADRVPATYQDLQNFDGFSECGISVLDLYSAPPKDEKGDHGHNTFCADRKTLLQAMSDGGRIGFDAPYISKGCHYRWYSIAEICMILERFDGVVFVGDSGLQSIYNGLNILLREDLASGALQSWALDHGNKADCRCENQFTKSVCSQNFVTASEQVIKSVEKGSGDPGDSYVCKQTPHAFLAIEAGQPVSEIINKFSDMVAKVHRSDYKPVPVIHSLSPSTSSHKDASTSLLEFLKLSDLSRRKVPMLWIGPTAAGHIEIRGRKTNQEIWDFDAALASVARSHDIEVLKMWNMTVQASSWDGVRFGEKVALVQAMMIINWLSRLETS